MFIDHSSVRSADAIRGMRKALYAPLIVPATLLALFVLGALVWAPSAHAQDKDNPTLADYTAVKNRIAMAKAEAELAEQERSAKGEGKQTSNGGQPSYSFAPQQSNARVAAPFDPTVLSIKAKADGGLVAMVSMGNGTVTPAWVGKSLGRGMTVKSISVTDVIVKDASGEHSLGWGDGSGSAAASNSATQTYGPVMPGAMPMPGMIPPPSVSN